MYKIQFIDDEHKAFMSCNCYIEVGFDDDSGR